MQKYFGMETKDLVQDLKHKIYMWSVMIQSLAP